MGITNKDSNQQGRFRLDIKEYLLTVRMRKHWVNGLRKVLKTSLLRGFEVRPVSARIETSVVVSIEGKRNRKCDLLNFVIAFFFHDYILCVYSGLLSGL